MKELGIINNFVFQQESIDIWLFASQTWKATVTNVYFTYLPKDLKVLLN